MERVRIFRYVHWSKVHDYAALGWYWDGGHMHMPHGNYSAMMEWFCDCKPVEPRKETTNMKREIKLKVSEIQSGIDRVRWAEGLICQLPILHDGANSWLLNYGVGPRAQALRDTRQIPFDKETQSAPDVS